MDKTSERSEQLEKAYEFALLIDEIKANLKVSHTSACIAMAILCAHAMKDCDISKDKYLALMERYWDHCEEWLKLNE